MADSITAWLNAAGRHPLLPQSEIVRLAQRRDQVEPGSKAYIKIINKIVTHNLRLIPKVVRQYIEKRQGSGLTMSSEVVSDLLQQASFGLRRAAEKYDPKKGFAFATYAHPWIYQSFTRWHNSCDRNIRIPANSMQELLYRQRHGKPSKTRNGQTLEPTMEAARQAFWVESIDAKVEEKDDALSLIDCLSEDHRILSRHTLDEDWAKRRLINLMNECEIKPRAQEIILRYASRGRMASVAAKLKLSVKHCQNVYGESVRKMKAHVEKQGQVSYVSHTARLSK